MSLLKGGGGGVGMARGVGWDWQAENALCFDFESEIKLEKVNHLC